MDEQKKSKNTVKPMNLIIEKIHIYDRETVKKVNSHHHQIVCQYPPILRVSRYEVATMGHGVPDETIADDGSNWMRSPIKTKWTWSSPAGLKYMIPAKEWAQWFYGIVKHAYPQTRKVYVVSCFNSFENEFQVRDVVFHFIGWKYQTVMTLFDDDFGKASNLLCVYAKDEKGSLTHHFIQNDKIMTKIMALEQYFLEYGWRMHINKYQRRENMKICAGVGAEFLGRHHIQEVICLN